MIASRPLLSKKVQKNFLGGGKMYFFSLRGGKISREKYFSIKLSVFESFNIKYYVIKFYQKLTNILKVMTFNVEKNQESYIFFMFFKIEMTFILESMGLHGSKIFNIEGNFKWEKKFLISIE